MPSSTSLPRLRPLVTAFRRTLLAFLLAFVAVGCAGGADMPSSVRNDLALRMEPLDLVFNEDTDKADVTFVNTGGTPIALGGFTFAGPDYEAFTFPGKDTPSMLPPGASATLSIGIDGGAVRSTVENDVPLREREGRARLKFTGNGTEQSYSLRHEPTSILFGFAIPALAKILLIILGFVMPLASGLTWLERKQSAMMQDRLGPNMAAIAVPGTSIRLRLWGVPFFLADTLKMLFKEDVMPRYVHKALYSLAPFLAFVPALAVFAIVPFGDALCYGHLFDVVSQADVNQCVEGRGGTALQVAHIDIGLLFYFAIASLASYGTTLAGWSSYNKWAMLGGLRASAQMISYEVAIGLTIVGGLLVYGSLEPHTLVRAQIDSHWGIVYQPLAFILFFTAAIAETKRAPFDMPEGESEIIGYFVEYSGLRFGLFMLSEFIEIIFASALVATLFLGGWSLPFGMMTASGFESTGSAAMFFVGAGTVLTLTGVGAMRASKAAGLFGTVLATIGSVHIMVGLVAGFTGWGTELPHLVVVLVGMVTWGVKIFVLCWLQLLIRWTLPRFRYDQLMALGWKGLLPLSLANLVVTATIVYLLLPTK